LPGTITALPSSSSGANVRRNCSSSAVRAAAQDGLDEPFRGFLAGRSDVQVRQVRDPAGRHAFPFRVRLVRDPTLARRK